MRASFNVLASLGRSTLFRSIFFIAGTFYSSAEKIARTEKTTLAHELQNQPCPDPIQPTPSIQSCSIKELMQKVNTLKERPIQISSLPKKNDYQKNILSLKEFLSTVLTCSKVIADTLQT